MATIEAGTYVLPELDEEGRSNGDRFLNQVLNLARKIDKLFEPITPAIDSFFEKIKEEPVDGYIYPTSRRNRIVVACSLGSLSGFGTTLASALIINAFEPQYNFLAIPIGAAVGMATGAYVSHLEKLYERRGDLKS